MSEQHADLYATNEERERAIRYSRIREWFTLVGLVWEMSINLLVLVSGASAAMRDAAERLTPRRLSRSVPFAAIWTLWTFLTSLPLSYLSGYEIEQRYGLSNQSRGAWMLEELKGLGVGIALGTPLLAGLYWVIRRWPSRWWAIVSGLTVPIAIIFTRLAPVLIMPLFNKYEPIKNRKLAERITSLAAREGVPVSDVLQMDMSKQTKKANAFFTGMGRSKRIVVGDTVLDEFTEDEIEVVLAHELGHQVHRDLWKLIALSAPLSAFGLFAAHALSPGILRRWGKSWKLNPERGLADEASIPLLFLLWGGATQLLLPIVNGLIRTQVEHPADAYALKLTRNPQAFIGAMEKLARMNLANPKPSALVKYLLYDHPPVGERIAFAREWREA
jgi:STE24 endopeptidase